MKPAFPDLPSICNLTLEQRGGRQCVDVFPAPLYGPASPPLSPPGIYICRFSSVVNIYVPCY